MQSANIRFNHSSNILLVILGQSEIFSGTIILFASTMNHFDRLHARSETSYQREENDGVKVLLPTNESIAVE